MPGIFQPASIPRRKYRNTPIFLPAAAKYLPALLDVGGKLIDRLWPDPEKAAAAKLELFKLEQSGELAKVIGQLEINKIEAGNPNLFVSGWWPAIGWICAGALMYQYIVRPMASWGAAVAGYALPTMPALDNQLWELLFWMFGMGALRTVEKIKDVAAK